MRQAIISDVHGNSTALKSVLADIKRRGVDEIVSLGDIIGYGPEPVLCLELVKEHCSWSLLGNHCEAVLSNNLENFNQVAFQSALWTREAINKHQNSKELLAYLEGNAVSYTHLTLPTKA